MNSQRPDIEQLKRYLQELPAAYESPDADRLESILQKVKRQHPRHERLTRPDHAFWWIVLVLFTGLATAAIWYQSRHVADNQGERIQTAPAIKQPHEVIPPRDGLQNSETENPVSRPDRRFIPR